MMIRLRQWIFLIANRRDRFCLVIANYWIEENRLKLFILKGSHKGSLLGSSSGGSDRDDVEVIHGSPGPQGPPGTDGARGPQGARGETGDTGTKIYFCKEMSCKQETR